MIRKIGIASMLLGAILITAAALLFFYNAREDQAAEKASQQMVSGIKSEIDGQRNATGATSEDTEGVAEPLPSSDEATDGAANIPEMKTVEIDGYDCIGYLSFPSLDLELPVMSSWDYARLKIAPCRQFGSTGTDDLVIAGHNFKSQFGRLSALQTDDTITFTDVDGNAIDYTVVTSKTLQPTSVLEVQHSGFDLVLYTCTYGGLTRVVIFCDRL